MLACEEEGEAWWLLQGGRVTSVGREQCSHENRLKLIMNKLRLKMMMGVRNTRSPGRSGERFL